MLHLRHVVLVFVHTCSVASAFAQGAPFAAGPAGAGTVFIPGVPAREAFVISPDGKPAKVTRLPTVRLQSEVLSKTEGLDELLNRHNLVADDKNRQMFRYLNPRTDLTQGAIQAGSKVDMFSASSQDPAQPSNLQYAFDSPNLTKYAFFSQAERARELTAAAKALPPGAFGQPSLANVHVQTTADLRFAAEALESRSDKLSRLEFAVAQFQVEYASKQAADINAFALRGVANNEQVLSASASAKAAKDIAERIQSGKPALDMRTLDVNVFNGNSSEHVKPLQVYVIPSGALNSPQRWTPEQLQSFFSDFSFANDASPVSQAIPTNFDPRVCIGPKNTIKGMADLVAARKLTTCRKPVPAPGSSKAILTFRWPEDVAKP